MNYKEDLDKILEGRPDLIPLRTPDPRADKWSDDLALTRADKLSFIPTLKDSFSERKQALIRFYSLYFNGVVEVGDSLVAVVADAVAIASIKGKPYWGDGSFKGDTFYTPNTSGKIMLSQEPPSGTYTDSAVTFKKKISELIDSLSMGKEYRHKDHSLFQVTGFLALTLWRAAVQREEQLKNSFRKSEYKKNVNFIGGWPAKHSYAPPCIECIQMVVCHLRKGRYTTSCMFYILAAEFIRLQTTEIPDAKQRLGYISASVMTQTARNGLRILSLLQTVFEVTGMEWEEVMCKSLFEGTVKLWIGFRDFASLHLNKEAPQYSYNWARVINDANLTELSLKQNFEIGALLSGILEKYVGERIWGPEWTMTKRTEHDMFILMGRAMVILKVATIGLHSGVYSSSEYTSEFE